MDESPPSMSTGDRGTIMGESGRGFPNDFSSTFNGFICSTGVDHDHLDCGEEQEGLSMHDLQPEGRHDWRCQTVVVVVLSIGYSV